VQRAEGLTLGVDVGASDGGDASALAVAYGGWVAELVVWWEADTMATCGRVVGEFRLLRVAREAPFSAALAETTVGAALLGTRPGDPLDYSGCEAEIYVDEVGVGKGVGDRLREQQYPCKSFMASRRPTRIAPPSSTPTSARKRTRGCGPSSFGVRSDFPTRPS
jgi:hypothetical protein